MDCRGERRTSMHNQIGAQSRALPDMSHRIANCAAAISRPHSRIVADSAASYRRFMSDTGYVRYCQSRSAAFAKRLLTASLSFPSSSAIRSLEFVRTLMTKDGALEALLASDDRSSNGVYRADLDDAQLANAFGTSCLSSIC